MIKMIGFDLDGTICDSIPLCIRALKIALTPYMGYEPSDKEIMYTFGLNEIGMIKKLAPSQWQNALADFYTIYENLHSMCPKPFPGIYELIVFPRQNHIIVPLITGKGEKSCMITLQKIGLHNLFHEICCGCEKHPNKSEHMLYLMHKYNVNKDEFLYIGDTVSDIEACRKAGITCLTALWSATNNDNELREKNPLYIFENTNTLKEFLRDIL